MFFSTTILNNQRAALQATLATCLRANWKGHSYHMRSFNPWKPARQKSDGEARPDVGIVYINMQWQKALHTNTVQTQIEVSQPSSETRQERNDIYIPAKSYSVSDDLNNNYVESKHQIMFFVACVKEFLKNEPAMIQT